ncbi:hypothetical protein G7054_g959 [Neopestalotiopsis clavispora]|nr:hypothetical protein G7054_g959 [Neopestalotiopsis clavispora]
MTVNMYQQFIMTQREMKGPPAAEQLSALEELLMDPHASVSEIAAKINRPYFQAIRDNPEDRTNPTEATCFRIWRSINNAVKQLADVNDRLAELVHEMLQSDEPVCANVSLRHFNLEWSEFAWNFQQPSSTDPDRKAKCQSWINMNAFCAKLSAYSDPRLDMLSDADWIIRHTLEKTPWEVYHHPDIEEDEEFRGEEYPAFRDYELEKRDVRSLNYWVPGAAVWFKLNSNGIYELEGPMAHEHDWSSTNWNGPKGWSKDRFAYWIERFDWISKVTALDRETRQLAVEAAQAMKQVTAVAK